MCTQKVQKRLSPSHRNRRYSVSSHLPHQVEMPKLVQAPKEILGDLTAKARSDWRCSISEEVNVIMLCRRNAFVSHGWGAVNGGRVVSEIWGRESWAKTLKKCS